MPDYETAALGLLHGVAEFLPISSSGHVALGHFIFELSSPTVTLMVMLQAGTLMASLWVVRQRLVAIVGTGLTAFRRPRELTQTATGRELVVVAVASVPTFLLTLWTADATRVWMEAPLVIAVGFFLTSGVLLSLRWVPRGEFGELTPFQALLVGIVQGVAVMPGVSRSGAAIGAGLWMGLRPERAFELSLMLSIPAFVATIATRAPDLAGAGPTPSEALAGILAFLSGMGSIFALRHAVARSYLALYVLWVLPLAMATFALAWAWPPRF
jgi:undecaprenyl-diphosphatase